MSTTKPNPTLLRSRREARIILLAYVVAMTWTGLVCWIWGYERAPEMITYPLGLGFPDWVLWGIVMPWLACNLFTAWFTLCYMTDERLTEEEVAHAE